MKNIIKHVPNFLTSCNLLCGCFAIVFCFKGELSVASWLILVATLFDFSDGMAARLLHVKSDIGKELDSLADCVTFGVAPSVIAYMLIDNSAQAPIIELFNINILPFIGFLIAVFSALRLAKFNLDTRQTDSFIGVPTPANAILFASFPLISQYSHNNPSGINIMADNIINNSYFIIVLIIFMSYLLVSELPLFSLKVKNLKWKDNEVRYIFIGFTLLVFGLLKFTAIPIIIFGYIVLSAFLSLKTNKIDA